MMNVYGGAFASINIIRRNQKENEVKNCRMGLAVNYVQKQALSRLLVFL